MNRKKDEETQTELEPESKKAKPSCEDEEEPAESLLFQILLILLKISVVDSVVEER